MQKYLGIVSIVILIATYLILESLVGKQIGHLWVWIIVIGYLSSALASWYSERGFWRKASVAVLIGLPIGYLAILVLFMFGISDF